MIIDFHTHTFPDKICAKVVDQLGRVARTKYFTNGSMQQLESSMETSTVDYSVNLPVMTNVKQVEKINHSFFAQREELLAKGIVAFGGMHPDYENYKEELKLLKENGILGIKLHPAYQNIDLDDIRMMRILDCASELGLITITHAGIDIGIYDHNYASVPMVLKVLKEVQPEKFVLAHMGNWMCWKEVESDLAGANVYFDTAFSVGRITPNPTIEEQPLWNYNLSDEDFVRLCRKHGVDKILFGTDSPWEEQADYLKRMQKMPFNMEETRLILGENAAKLLGISQIK